MCSATQPCHKLLFMPFLHVHGNCDHQHGYHCDPCLWIFPHYLILLWEIIGSGGTCRWSEAGSSFSSLRQFASWKTWSSKTTVVADPELDPRRMVWRWRINILPTACHKYFVLCHVACNVSIPQQDIPMR